jgi:hypothetical protein
MVSLEIKLVFVVMGFDLLLMLIINLTVFLIISVGSLMESRVVVLLFHSEVAAMRGRTRNMERKREEEKNVNIGALGSEETQKKTKTKLNRAK